MKRTLLVSLVALSLAPVASAQGKDFNPDCHLEGINQGLDGVRDEIKSSPALGHAGGHYKRALQDIEKLRKQLHEGCHAWIKSAKPQ
jgi:hypothetical protein